MGSNRIQRTYTRYGGGRSPAEHAGGAPPPDRETSQGAPTFQRNVGLLLDHDALFFLDVACEDGEGGGIIV